LFGADGSGLFRGLLGAKLLSMNLPLVAAGALVAFGPAEGERGLAPVTGAQCEVATAYAEMLAGEFRERRRVFDASAFLFLELPQANSPWVRAGDAQPVPGPPFPLIQALTNRNPLNVCPTMRARLTAMHISYGVAAARQAVRHRSNGHFGAVILTISMPSVSADGRDAVLGESSYFGPLSGGASLIHLQRNGTGRWQVVGQIGLYVS
jgi:hypothetical protein